MSKVKVSAVPNTSTLIALMKEYQQMLGESERAVKKLLALSPQSEKFWDELSSAASLFTMVGDRSNSIWEEIQELVDQLPEE